MKESSKALPEIIKKWFSVLSGKPEKEESREDQERFTTHDSDPVDLQFVKRFTNSGGKFLLCTNENELLESLNDLSEELGTSTAFCASASCQDLMRHIRHPFEWQSIQDAQLFVTDCEALVAFNGSIMISSRQKGDKKLEELPRNVVVLAQAEQIVHKLNDGLAAIRERSQGNIPVQITTIHGPKQIGPVDSSPGFESVYLLLLDFQS